MFPCRFYVERHHVPVQVLYQGKKHGIAGIVDHVSDAVVIVGQGNSCPHGTLRYENRIRTPDTTVKTSDGSGILRKGIDRCGHRTCQ